MMSTILSSLVSLLLLLILYFVLYRRFAIDNYRDQLFKIREALFDLAIDNETLSFKSEIYKNFETRLNNNIRFAHRISFLGAILFNVMNRIRYPGSNIQSKVASDFLRQAAAMRQSATKDRIMQLKAAFDTQTIKYLLRISPLFCLYVVLIWLRFAFGQILQLGRVKSQVKTVLVGEVNREIELQAENYSSGPALAAA